MLFILNQVYRFLRMLHADITPVQLASGLTLGLCVGLTPWDTLQGIIFLVAVCLFRVQFVATTLSTLCFSMIALVIRPWLHALGIVLLTKVSALQPTYHLFSDMPIVPYTRFYNSVVMGSAAICLCLAPVILLSSWFLFSRFWSQWEQLFLTSRLWTWWQQTLPYLWYENYAVLTLDELRTYAQEQQTQETSHAP